MPRTPHIRRNTKETQIDLHLNLDGRGEAEISTGIPFFDHMLDLVTRHGGFDLRLNATGDLDVDQHHTVEDVGIALGGAVNAALRSKRGILRAGYFLMPMDETLAAAAVVWAGARFAWSRRSSRPRASAIFRPSWSKTFFTDLRKAPGPTCIYVSFMAARRTIRLRRFSKRLPAHCVSPFRATNGCVMYCQARRSFCEGRVDRLRRRQCHFRGARIASPRCNDCVHQSS